MLCSRFDTSKKSGIEFFTPSKLIFSPEAFQNQTKTNQTSTKKKTNQPEKIVVQERKSAKNLTIKQTKKRDRHS